MNNHSRIHKEGIGLIIGFGLLMLTIVLICFWLCPIWLAWVIFAIAITLNVFFIQFFRNPNRVIDNTDPLDIYAPADGKIVVIEPTFEYQVLQEKRLQISIFMSITNVHANWYPFEGRILDVYYRNGHYKAAYLPKSSSENEQSAILLETKSNGKTVLLKQIAGALARRIVTYARKGETCQLNQQLGFIKFGSRVDLFLPLDQVEILVKLGDKVKGNQTILARFK